MKLIFAGAGASTAVSKEKYPTTLEYFAKLDSSITNDSIFKSVITDVENSGESLDIENVLFRLGWILEKLKISTEKNHPYYNCFQGLLTQQRLMPICQQLFDRINSKVFSYYSQKPSETELKNNWKLLIEHLIKNQKKVNIFTTNYDTVIETALAKCDKKNELNITDGFQLEETGESSFDIRNWDLKDEKYPLLTKLHGSINWGGTGSGLFKRPASNWDKNGANPLIYPGYKGTPSYSPYRNFHDYFQWCLPRTEHIIVIGYAFRDDFINTCFGKLNSNAIVTNIGYGEEPNSVPAFIKSKKTYEYIDSGFGEEAINRLKE